MNTDVARLPAARPVGTPVRAEALPAVPSGDERPIDGWADKRPLVLPTRLAVPGAGDALATPRARALGRATSPQRWSVDTSGIPSEVTDRLDELGIKVSTSDEHQVAFLYGSTLMKERVGGSLSGGPGTRNVISGKLNPDGTIEVRSDINSGAANVTVTIDPTQRTVRTTYSGYRRPESEPLPYTTRDLREAERRLLNGEATPADGRMHWRQLSDVPSFQTMFAAFDSSSTSNMHAAEMPSPLADGLRGVSWDESAFTSPVPSEATIRNELVEQVMNREANRAFRGSVAPWDPTGELDFIIDRNRGNWFGGFTPAMGTPGASGWRNDGDNAQARELISDAASINADARDVFRVAAFSSADRDDNYYLAANYARQVLTDINNAREPGRRIMFMGDALHGSAAEIERQMHLTRDELAQVQRAYLSMGTQLVQHWHRELATRYPPHWWY